MNHWDMIWYFVRFSYWQLKLYPFKCLHVGELRCPDTLRGLAEKQRNYSSGGEAGLKKQLATKQTRMEIFFSVQHLA